jgi:hypothetical protein
MQIYLVYAYAYDLQLFINLICKPEEIAKCVRLVNDILSDIVNWSAKQGFKLNLNQSLAIIIGSERAHMKLDFTQIPKVALDGVTHMAPLEYVYFFVLHCLLYLFTFLVSNCT